MRAPILLAMAIALASIVGATAQPVSAPIDQRAIMAATPPPLLSAYHFFSDPGARQPSAGVTPYDLNTALYSDGALKFRYLYLPPGQAARFSASDVFGFPVGAVLIKTFAFAADMRAPGRNVRFLETRLLIHRLEGWVALAYVWKDRKSTRLNSSHIQKSRMPSSA